MMDALDEISLSETVDYIKTNAQRGGKLQDKNDIHAIQER